MFGQNADLQKLVVLNNNVLMQLVQFVGSLQAVQAGTVDALDFLTHGDKGQAIDLLILAADVVGYSRLWGAFFCKRRNEAPGGVVSVSPLKRRHHPGGLGAASFSRPSVGVMRSTGLMILLSWRL